MLTLGGLQYAFYNKDPRRLQPLVDYLLSQFKTLDFNAESTFDVVRVLCFFRAFYEELNWKFAAWTDEVLRRCWPEISSEHDDVRSAPVSSSPTAHCPHISRYSRTSVRSWHSAVKSWCVRSVGNIISCSWHSSGNQAYLGRWRKA